MECCYKLTQCCRALTLALARLSCPLKSVDKQRDRQIYETDHTIHASATAGLGNEHLFIRQITDSNIKSNTRTMPVEPRVKMYRLHTRTVTDIH